jgi:uncharacterized membrane protein (UPF0127 family)
MTTYTKVVVQDEQTDEYLIEFSEDELKQIGWQLGDVLEWSDNKDGSWTLKKKEDRHG